MGAVKYFALGLVVYFSLGLISFGLSWYGLFDYLYYISTSIGIAVILAVGLIKGSRCAIAFGFSYFIANLAVDYLIVAPILYSAWGIPYYYWFWQNVMECALWTAVQICYGYLPSKLYSSRKRTSMMLLGWIMAFSFDVIARELFIPAALPQIISNLVIGGLSVGLCARHLRGMSPSIPVPTKPSGITPSSTLRCRSCGYENPARFTYCGKCGTPLKEEDTKIY
jgi:hypothetical protein